jgi:hypothetical protein
MTSTKKKPMEARRSWAGAVVERRTRKPATTNAMRARNSITL